MPFVLSLICNPAVPALEAEWLARVAVLLPRSAPPLWLAPGIAAEITFTPAHPDTLAAIKVQAQAAIDLAPIDVNVLPAEDRRKRLILADMDSTIIEQECLDELAAAAGFGPKVAAITERAMRGEIAFEPALRERVALLKGLPVSVLDRVLRDRISLTPGAHTLVRTMRAHGAHAALISGGFTFFTERVARMAGFTEHRGNRLDFDGDHLAGTVAEPILGRAAKRATLLELREILKLSPQDSLAVGDGANDLDMLLEAGLGIAFRAKPAVAAAARASIVHGDLTALLYLQGYSQDQFVG